MNELPICPTCNERCGNFVCPCCFQHNDRPWKCDDCKTHALPCGGTRLAEKGIDYPYPPYNEMHRAPAKNSILGDKFIERTLFVFVIAVIVMSLIQLIWG